MTRKLAKKFMSKCKENRIIHSAEEKAKEANRFLGHKVSLN